MMIIYNSKERQLSGKYLEFLALMQGEIISNPGSMIFLRESDEPVTTPQQELRLTAILQQQNGRHLASFSKVIFVNG